MAWWKREPERAGRGMRSMIASDANAVRQEGKHGQRKYLQQVGRKKEGSHKLQLLKSYLHIHIHIQIHNVAVCYNTHGSF